jgi:hypothetical protein
VVLHVKPYPYYVSDATTPDVVACLRRMAATREAPADVAGRIRHALVAGRIELYTHWFYCSPLTFHQLPSDLADELSRTSITLLKGDLNYRRLVGDLNWPPTTPFADAAGYFPTPVVALRTLKSDVVVGMNDAVIANLDACRNGSYPLHQTMHAYPANTPPSSASSTSRSPWSCAAMYRWNSCGCLPGQPTAAKAAASGGRSAGFSGRISTPTR